ncbi:MAG: UDP-4-amino-4,6-dideoxy-N-acetyl-beta-L-altrosamine transaminase [Candidatus Buchananbacteria bacterium RIFCSPHIGHO2_01_FULL_39_14]|uniref:UDP-4-amino-4, 6-dideoxy-N-acetyl-beta-L-altrosamine transaminase n=1 Tax=Candidatus Buchananbacteria bacterium RIFCSPHIGHO2_01_FULL_39_14 TaxID=1797532 RepID=A0A1G1Y049_9BACT|nr:MAG: UDP-4-amino-4,6-dideoxy-N-acetyl-beta-L-altrosamine transaminase [Candidatus Buchananbacteria bacterium RIFCSPHIGHO2_01_FULL_39_14]OGY48652.1 MAG: UDP-4-amino-4,6-dideoxy-N-acetyl-beta-L-altrosamine transaminase [Candidatus Buchananbacteria bacterium RIFCSPHIGHO2_02_FULL_39_17]
MIPYGHQTIDQKDINSVLAVLQSDWLTQGPKVLEFEKALAKYCGAKYAVSACNGTAALHLAYLAAGLKKGDEVITTPNTFAATTNMLLAVGAKPVFTEIRLDSYNLDENQIEKLINKKIKAIVPVHFAGQPADLAKIKKIAKKHRLLVIEDACHALGAKYHGNKIGDCRYSDLAVFSFHPVKTITTGEGGVILTNNKKFYDQLILLRNHGIYKDKNGKNVMVELGYNYRLNDLACALGISQLKKIKPIISKKRQIAQWYNEELKNVKEVILPKELKGNYSSWHLYIVRVDKKYRDLLAKYLKQKDIGVNFHYPAVYSYPYYQKLGFGKNNLKNSKIYHQTTLTLPLPPQLMKSQVKYISNQIKFFFGYEV